VKRTNFDSSRLNSAKKIKVDDNFIPCPIEEDDELYPNGIFLFNITKMLEYINKFSNEIDLVDVNVADFPKCFSSINESHLDSVDVYQPVIIAEISPGHYNLIDGNHRMEKARRLGINSISAYKLNVDQHISFLTEKKAYQSYVDYWNGKLK
jgi:ParB-like nuclease family protein